MLAGLAYSIASVCSPLNVSIVFQRKIHINEKCSSTCLCLQKSVIARLPPKYWSVWQYWGFPSGRIEDGEPPLDAAEREALEETSVSTKELNLAAELVDPTLPIRHYFYLCFDWVGKIENAEPNLCRELRWFNLDELPEKCTPITYVAMKKIKNALRDHQQRT